MRYFSMIRNRSHVGTEKGRAINKAHFFFFSSLFSFQVGNKVGENSNIALSGGETSVIF